MSNALSYDRYWGHSQWLRVTRLAMRDPGTEFQVNDHEN
jgi:hypothetical protein